MPTKDNSSLYLETSVAVQAKQQTEYSSVSQLVNALLSGYLEGVYDPFNDFDVSDEDKSGWGVRDAPHTREGVRTAIQATENVASTDVSRVDEIEARIEQLERAFEKESGIPPHEY